MQNSTKPSIQVPNGRLIWNTVTQDKRICAAVLAYFISSVWYSVFEDFVFFDIKGFFCVAPIVRLVGLVVSIYIICEPQQYEYSMQGFTLGSVCGICISFGLYEIEKPFIQIFCTYAYIFGIFHFSEFLVTGLTNNESLKADSFLLNHSKMYWIAASLSWLEFFGESFFFPNFYSYYMCALGAIFCLIGEVLRKLAMCHAATGFTHKIAVSRKKHHTLQTSGVYALCRHPGYLGWLIWSVGTQIILCNPICLVVYAYVVYHFFKDRICEEEYYLINFFGERYIAYQKNVGVGIPGIRGFVPTL